jgi:hypothetical protein
MQRGTATPAGRRIDRNLLGLILALLAGAVLVAILAMPSGATAKHKNKGKHHKAKSLKVSFSGSTQSDQTLLSAGSVTVKVRSPGKRRLVLTVTGFAGGPALTDPLRVSAKSGKPKTFALPLNVAGREVLQGCGTDSLLLTGKALKSKKKKRKKGKKSAKRGLTAQATVTQSVPQCTSLAHADRCEIIASPGTNCLFPFPSDHYTAPDPSTPTGLRVNLSPESTPANASGAHIDPAGINTSDGFSPGESIVTRIPGFDTDQAFQNTGAVPLTDMDRAFDPDQPIVLIDASTGARQLIWSELDATASSPANTDLIIRPGKNLIEGHRYIVALRNLKDASGATLPAPPGFALYRDGVQTDVAPIEQRRAHFDEIFSKLQQAGIDRGNLYDAWDFTVASTPNITERMLSIRDRGLADLNDTTPGDGIMQGDAPGFDVTDVTDFGTDTTGHGAQNIREVTGTYEVPCYLDSGCSDIDGNYLPGGEFDLGSDGLPQPNGTMTARFTCNIPRSAVTDTGGGVFDVDHQVRPSMYGHGLFGDYTEVHTTNVRQLGTDEGVLTCATDWTGMMEDDVGTAITALQDLSNFQALPDGLQQGFLNFIYLGRLLMQPDGFSSNDAFKFGGTSVIDHTQGLYYYGNSQGGIAGGALTAVEPDITRTVLYVPGMNYSTLLTRSVDFNDYALILYPSYPNESERPLLLALIQMMWDRGEPNGYANHMTSDPLPNTPAHHVLIEMAYGDHQVSNVATEVEARTIGAPLRYPTLDPGRTPGFVDFFPDIPQLDLPSDADGNGMFVWDIGPKRDNGSGGFLGTDPAPITNTAPDDTFGVDPHDTVINTSPDIRHQIAEFLKPDGQIIDVCTTPSVHPCYAAGWTGPP